MSLVNDGEWYLLTAPYLTFKIKIMKKLLFILLFIPMLSLANDTTIVAESETERIIDKYGGKIVESFNNFAEQALPIAKEGFEVVVRLQIAKGIGYMLIIPVLILFIIVCNRSRNKSETIHERYGHTDSHEVIYTISLVGICLSSIALIPMVYHGLLYLIAPEWFAIKEIIGLF